ncbi:hypothetical protein [Streptomyces sp. enrichment culture]|uniref:hypothetical protein n=1 Tax=Streptomyces sp. enrichment culture TaxID=1795815 RepID=UPI003F54C9FB
MKPFKRTVAAMAATLAALSLAACGSSPDSPDGTDREPAPEQSAAGAAAPKKAIPEAFDSTKGWVAEPDGNTGDELGSPVIAADAGLVLLRSNTADGKSSRIVAHDARTGAIRWASEPMVRPAPGDGHDHIDVRVFVTHKDGKEYAVLAATGTEGGDAVNKGAGVTRLAVYDTASTGKQAAPVRETTLPGLASGGFTVLRDGGLALVRLDDSTAVVDVLSGRVTTHDRQSPALKSPKPCDQLIASCETDARIVGITPKGPLVQGFRAFWVSGGWFSGDAVPAGAIASEGSRDVEVYGTQGGQVVAAWPSETGPADTSIWAVHDGSTGEVVASVACEAPDDDPLEPAVSADGRYVIADLAVFDLRAKRGHCFESTSARNRVELVAVDKDGTAYGNAMEVGTVGTTRAPASVDLGTGKASALPEGTLVPDLIGADAAVFGTSSGGGERILVYPRR